MLNLALLKPDAAEDVEAPPEKRFLDERDFTWLEDPADPRYGQVHVSQKEAVELICKNIGVRDAVREFLLLCARQSAKTTTILLAFIKTMTERPGSKCLYVSFDLATGQELIYEPIQDRLTKMGWKFKASAGGPSGLRIKLENGSILQCRSADDIRAAGRLRGRGWDLIGGDELQDMLDVLQKLFDEVLGPTTFRRSGVTVGAFTPPDVQIGWLWDQWNSGAWQRLGWPMSENPFLPPGAAERWLKQRGLTLEHPVARREVLGLWEPNVEKQVFEFNYATNTYDARVSDPTQPAVLPNDKRDFPPEHWVYGFGGDIGWEHASGLTFLAWNLRDPQRRIFEVLTLEGPKWTLDTWFGHLMDFRIHIQRKGYRSAIMDQAGAGAMNVIHSLEQRFREMGLPISIGYKPANVPATVAMVNDSFRLGRLFLRRDSPLIHEFAKTVWKDGSNRQEIDKAKFDPHGLDALRYGVWGATNHKAHAMPATPQMTTEEAKEAEIDAQIAQYVAAKQRSRWR